MPPKKKKKKPDGIVGRISPAMKSEHFEMAGGGYGSRGTGTSRAALSGLMKNFMRQFTGKPKKKPPSGKPGTASNPNDRAASARASSRKSSATHDAKAKWAKEWTERKSRDAKKILMAQQATRSAVARRKAGIAAGRAASSAGSPKKPVTPSERATGSRRGVPVGTNQKSAAKKKAKKKTKRR